MKITTLLKNLFFSFTGLLLIWSAICYFGKFPPALLPGPFAVAKALFELFRNGIMLENIASSLWRFAIGYCASVVVGTLLGLLLGHCRRAYDLVSPVLHFFRPIAPVAWMPFIVLLIGIGDVPAIAIIFLAGFFPVLLSTVVAVRNLDPVYRKIAANYGITFPTILWKIEFPAAFPAIANSLHIALGSAWIFLVSGEMIGTQSGLGYLIIDARNNMRTDHLLAAMVVIGIIGLLLDLAIGRFEKFILNIWGRDQHVY